MQFEIREMTIADYNDAVALWNSVESLDFCKATGWTAYEDLLFMTKATDS